MARLRYNGLTATLGAALASGDTSITFAAALTHAGGTAVPTITGSDYIPLGILDANGVLAEVVNLTAYTSAATTGTISRAQESTTAKAHASGVTLIHGPTVSDIQSGAVAATAKVKKSTTQAVAANTLTAITWETEVWDDANFFTSGSPTRFTIPAGMGGKYLLNSHITRSSVASNFYATSFLVNGVEVDTAWSNITIGGGYTGVTSTIVSVVAGDYIQATVYSAVACNVEARSEFSIARLGS